MGQAILTPLQRHVLKHLSKEPLIGKNFYLTGGTALAEYYLHHRLSEDLDFFCEKEIDILWVTTLAQRIKQKIHATKVDIQQSYNRNLVFFTVNTHLLKTEFTYFPFPNIEQPKVQGGIRIDSLLDIAVNKFFTIYQQPASRHFIDLYSILKQGDITWEQIKKLARNKFDVVIDSLQLGSQLFAAKDIGQLPTMIQPLHEKEWRDFFLTKAKELKEKIGT